MLLYVIILSLALSLTVLANLFMAGFFIMMLRRNPSQKLRNFDENSWRKNAPFSTINFFGFREKVLHYGKHILSLLQIQEMNYSNNSSNQIHIVSYWVWEFYIVFIRPYWSIPAPGSKGSKFWKSILMVLLILF